MSNNGGDFFKGLIFGGLIGALIGVLYAPKSGRQTRAELARKADEFMAKAKEELEKSKEEYETMFGEIKKEGASLKSRAAGVGEKIGTLALSGKKSVQDKKKRLTRALSAGVAAYRQEKNKKKRSSSRKD